MKRTEQRDITQPDITPENGGVLLKECQGCLNDYLKDKETDIVAIAIDQSFGVFHRVVLDDQNKEATLCGIGGAFTMIPFPKGP